MGFPDQNQRRGFLNHFFSFPEPGQRSRRQRRPGGSRAESLEQRLLLTVDLQLDYSRDTNNFFSAAARSELERAAAVFEAVLADDLARIDNTDFPGSSWSARFTHPGTGATESISNLVVPADTLIVYAGGRASLGSIGEGGPGGFSASGSSAWLDVISARGEAGALGVAASRTDFGPWGGSIAFDSGVNWSFDPAGPDGGETDFYSVALHELAHLLGFGTSPSFNNLVDGGQSEFLGTVSVATHGSNVPMSGSGHWQSGLESSLPGTLLTQETALDPELTVGTRKEMTALDFAALDDIGWDIAQTETYDYGDAPDISSGTGTGNYQTLASDSGPRHTLRAGLFLGSTVDADSGTLQDVAALADDADGAGGDDEDGVLNLQDLQLTVGAAPRVSLKVTNSTGTDAILAGWLDLNVDGIFDSGTERNHVLVPSGGPTIVTLDLPVPDGSYTGVTYARFRLSTDPAAFSSTGVASDGEVEDYAVVIVDTGQPEIADVATIGHQAGGGSNLADSDAFGSAVASAGDWNLDGTPDVIVGLPGEDGGGTDRGGVDILLMSSDGTTSSVLTLRSGANGMPALSDGDGFGSSVGVLGDLNGDGNIEIAVGAPGVDVGGNGRGGVYILSVAPNGSVTGSVLLASGQNGIPVLSDGDVFGYALAPLGDLNQDGIPDLAVGAPGDSAVNTGKGAIYLLNLNTAGGVTNSVRIENPNAASPTLGNTDAFGAALAAIGDFNFDGVVDIAVGVPGQDNAGTDRGAVMTFGLNADSTVKTSRTLQLNGTSNPISANGDAFGSALSSGPLNTDRVRDLLVGSSGVAGNEGAIFALTLNSSGSFTSVTQYSNGSSGVLSPEAGDRLGAAVAFIGDLTGDGISEVAAGLPGADAGGTDRGVLAVAELSPEWNTTPLFDWPDIPNATAYELWVDNLSTATSQVIYQTNLSRSWYQSEAGLAPGNYRWWYRSFVGGSWTPYSRPTDLTIEAKGPLPVPVMPTGTTDSASPLFSWSSMPGATRYEIWLNDVSRGLNGFVRQDQIPTTAWRPPVDLAPGNYRFWLRGYSTANPSGTWTSPTDFTVTAGNAVPVIETPSGSSSETRPLVAWKPVPGAAWYELEINDITRGLTPAVSETRLTTSAFTLQDPLLQGNYQVRVRAYDSGGVAGAWSPVVNFAVEAGSGPPVLLARGGRTHSVVPEFHWTQVTGATRYDLWVSDLTRGTAQIIRQENLPFTSFRPDHPLQPGTYRAWVQAYNGNTSIGGWSALQDLTIRDVPGPALIETPRGSSTAPTPSFSWGQVRSATHYDLWVDRLSGGFQSQVIRQQNLKVPYFDDYAALEPGTYRFWVRPWNGSTALADWSQEEHFVVEAMTGETEFHTPVRGVTNDTAPQFSWAAVTGITRYDLWVDNLTTAESQYIRNSNITTTVYRDARTLAPGTYRAYIRYYNSTGTPQPWNRPLTFEVAAVNGAPVVVTPLSGTTAALADTRIVWSAVNNAVRYELIIDNVTTAQNGVISETNLTETSYDPTGLTAGEYRVWIRAIDGADNASDWSVAVHFNVTDAAEQSETPLDIAERVLLTSLETPADKNVRPDAHSPKAPHTASVPAAQESPLPAIEGDEAAAASTPPVAVTGPVLNSMTAAMDRRSGHLSSKKAEEAGVDEVFALLGNTTW